LITTGYANPREFHLSVTCSGLCLLDGGQPKNR
jgi:hypothetical protein